MSKSRRLFLGDLSDAFPVVDVGQFSIEEPIGLGSMGEVWRGTHAEQDVVVALKVIVSEQALNERSHRAFRQEVRSMAELNHPFIVDVHDYGTIDDEAESDSFGQLQAGSPYLVMEYAAHGSLGDASFEKADWEVVRLILLSVLDALAHSHARGVLHRDVKPQNILLAKLEGGPGIKLTDFGLAYALRKNQELANWHRTAGTPEYMAPEQVVGKWRHYGPATDLYALGCVTYELLTGYPPFRGDNVVQLAQAHLEEELPPLPDDIDAPADMDKWLRGLLAKEPKHRFSTAADAARALRQIDGSPFDNNRLLNAWQRLVSLVDPDHAATPSQWADSMVPTHSLDVLVRQPAPNPVHEQPSKVIPPNLRQTPPSAHHIPEHWCRGDRPYFSRRLMGTGRGLFELRRLPFFGRDDERDHLWHRLRRCAEDHQPRVTLLTGPPGVGKTYLGRWLCDRVAELGAAQIFRAHHEHTEEVVDQLAIMLRRRYSLFGQDRSQIEDFFEPILQDLGATDSYEWQALAELIHASQDPSATARFHFTSPKQRWMVYLRFFERLSSRAPILLWFNDVQWGLQTLHFVETLLNYHTLQAPIFVVMTGRDDLLSHSSLHRRHLDSILDSQWTDRIELPPLDERTLRRLVKEALFLDPAATYEVTRRAGGNPRHALAIVGDWIDRDLLETTRHGYTLSENAELDTSGDWTDIWARVIERLTDGCEDSRIALELAAILGERFRPDVWETAALLEGLEIPQELAGTLLRQKQLRSTEGELVFTHNWLREALFESARTHRRWERLCLTCARALDECSTSSTAVDEPVGFLLLEADKPVEGGRRLLSALERYFAQRDYLAMLHLSRRGIRAVQDLRDEEALRLHMRFLTHLSHGWHSVSANDRALEAASLSADLARRLGDKSQIGVAARYSATARYMSGNIEGAKAHCHVVEQNLTDQLDFQDHFAQALLTRAHIAMMEDEYELAMQCIHRARRAMSHAADPVVDNQIEYVRMKALVLQGRDDELCFDDIDELVQRCLDAGTTLGAAHCANLGGEVARHRGDLSQARIWYQRCLELFRILEPDRVLLPLHNLTLVAIAEGKINLAGHQAEAILQQLRRINRPQFELATTATKLPMLAANGDTEALRAHIELMQSIIKKLGFGSDRDIAMCLRLTIDELRKKESQQALLQLLEDMLAIVKP